MEMECARQSVRPVVIDYRSAGVYSVGLTPAESVEVRSRSKISFPNGVVSS
jgi:hypothetical protein